MPRELLELFRNKVEEHWYDFSMNDTLNGLGGLNDSVVAILLPSPMDWDLLKTW